MNSLIDNLLIQLFYIQNRKMRLSKKFLYQDFVVFCRAWEGSLHSTKSLKKIQTTPDSLN